MTGVIIIPSQEVRQPFIGHVDVERLVVETVRSFLFRIGEHHAIITIGDWLKSTEQLELKDGFARLIWHEARHTSIWTQRMKELIGEDAVARLYPDPRHVDFGNDEYFRLWDEYGKAGALPQRLAYVYVADGWATIAYDTYLKSVDPMAKWHLQTILHDERFHVGFGRKMAERYVTSDRDRDLLQREEEKIGNILAEVTDGFLRAEV